MYQPPSWEEGEQRNPRPSLRLTCYPGRTAIPLPTISQIRKEVLSIQAKGSSSKECSSPGKEGRSSSAGSGLPRAKPQALS